MKLVLALLLALCYVVAVDADLESVGKDVVDRPLVDTATYWTMVDNEEFPHDGHVDTIEVFSGAANRGLRIGIYRPTSDAACEFQLVKQIEFSSFAVGYNKVTLTEDQVLDVLAGDHFGFTWLNLGVVKYNQATTYQYCEDSIKPDEGSNVVLKSSRHGNREYSIRLTYGCDPETIGNYVVDRTLLDTSTYWTMVQVEEFSKNGHVDSIEVFSGAANRRLRIGIYRPTSDAACEFQLVKQNEFLGFAVGYNKVTLTEDQVLDVSAGDHFGFTWLNLGVVKYNHATTYQYCEDSIKPDEGSNVVLKSSRHGNREYSIKITVIC